MNCPYCDSDSHVTNSRHQKRTNSVWRRRQCKKCDAIWTTTERLQGSGTYKIKADKHLIDFHPEILLISLYEALKHRKTPEIDAQYVYGTVLANIQNAKEPVFTTNQIAKECYGVLKNYDKLSADLYKTLHPYTD